MESRRSSTIRRNRHHNRRSHLQTTLRHRHRIYRQFLSFVMHLQLEPLRQKILHHQPNRLRPLFLRQLLQCRNGLRILLRRNIELRRPNPSRPPRYLLLTTQIQVVSKLQDSYQRLVPGLKFVARQHQAGARLIRIARLNRRYFKRRSHNRSLRQHPARHSRRHPPHSSQQQPSSIAPNPSGHHAESLLGSAQRTCPISRLLPATGPSVPQLAN